MPSSYTAPICDCGVSVDEHGGERGDCPDVPCANCGDAHPVDVSCSANARDAVDADRFTISKTSGDWLAGGPLSPAERHVIVASLLPGWSPDDVAALGEPSQPGTPLNDSEWQLVERALDVDRLRRYYARDGLLAKAIQQIVDGRAAGGDR